MSSHCLICGVQCKGYKRQLTVKVSRLEKEFSSKSEEDGLFWILSLDSKLLADEELLCGTCWRLVGQLRHHETRAANTRSELLNRHSDWCRRQAGLPAPSQPDDAAAATAEVSQEEDEAPLSTRLPRRRSARLRRSGASTPTPQIKTEPNGELQESERIVVEPEHLFIDDGDASDVADADAGDDVKDADWQAGEVDDGDAGGDDDGGDSDEVLEADGAVSDAGSEYIPSGAVKKPAVSLKCQLCDETFSSRLQLGAHKANAHRDRPKNSRRPYACHMCEKAFKNASSLCTHRRHAHSGGLPCDQDGCTDTFKDHITFYRHLTDVHGIKDYVCEHCGAGFARKVLYNKHMVKEEKRLKRQKRKDDLRELRCSQCSFSPTVAEPGRRLAANLRLLSETAVISKIRDHEYTKHKLHQDPLPEPVDPKLPNVYRCSPCNLAYACRKALEHHKYKNHRDLEKAALKNKMMTVCELCGKEVHQHYLKTHQRSTHKVGDPSELLTCQHCGKQFHKYKQAHFISHLQKVHNVMGVELQCPEPGCNRTFRHQRGLKRHIRGFHSRSVPCGVCGQFFSTTWQRDKHAAEVHGQYDFMCDECGQKFFRASELDIHRRRQHTLQLRLQCSVCDHRSEEKRKLLNHENAAHQMHREPLPPSNPSGQLSYPCLAPDCGLLFACGNVVKQHAWEQHRMKLNIYGRPQNPTPSKPRDRSGRERLSGSELLSGRARRAVAPEVPFIAAYPADTQQSHSAQSAPYNLSLEQLTAALAAAPEAVG